MLLSKLKIHLKLASCDISQVAIASSVLIVAQLAFAFLPNVELVTLLIVLYTIHMRFKAVYVIYVFVFIEGLIFGFSIWWIAYLYVWLVLFIFSYIFRSVDSPIVWSFICAIFGISFGALTSLPYLVTGGVYAMFAYISSGVIFDLIHCVSNFIIAFILFKPLNNLYNKISNR